MERNNFMKTVIIIPARWKSKRFPGKPLVKINKKELTHSDSSDFTISSISPFNMLLKYFYEGNELTFTSGTKYDLQISHNGNSISFFLAHSLIQLEAPVWIDGFFGMNYTNFSWPNESNKINKILPVAGIHLGLQPLPSILPPLLLGINITVTPYPKSYNEIDGVIQFDDWGIQFSPAVEIGLAIPKYIFFPE